MSKYHQYCRNINYPREYDHARKIRDWIISLSDSDIYSKFTVPKRMNKVTNTVICQKPMVVMQILENTVLINVSYL